MNLSSFLSYDALTHVAFADLFQAVRLSCARGKEMHPEALKSVVFRLTAFSRDLTLKQRERDEAAEMANLLANTALQAHGPHSDYGRDLLAGVQMIASRNVA